MVEKELINYLETQPNRKGRVLSKIRTCVERGIRLEDASYLRISPDTREFIVSQISETIYDTSDFLGISHPEVTLIYPWNGSPGESPDSDQNVIANASRAKNAKKGAIGFSPLYLQSVVDYVQMGKREGMAFKMGRNSLYQITSHEQYHIWQFLEFPTVAHKHIDVLKQEGQNEWNSTWTERGAQMFGDMFDLNIAKINNLRRRRIVK